MSHPDKLFSFASTIHNSLYMELNYKKASLLHHLYYTIVPASTRLQYILYIEVEGGADTVYIITVPN